MLQSYDHRWRCARAFAHTSKHSCLSHPNIRAHTPARKHAYYRYYFSIDVFTIDTFLLQMSLHATTRAHRHYYFSLNFRTLALSLSLARAHTHSFFQFLFFFVNLFLSQSLPSSPLLISVCLSFCLSLSPYRTEGVHRSTFKGHLSPPPLSGLSPSPPPPPPHAVHSTKSTAVCDCTTCVQCLVERGCCDKCMSTHTSVCLLPCCKKAVEHTLDKTYHR